MALSYGAFNPAKYTDSGVFSRRSAKTFLPHYLKEDVDAVIEAATTGNQECEVRPGRCCSRRHRMPSTSRNEGSKCVSMTWQEIHARL